MRKMTYTQAATCGENLKVRVTPEQSEKMQKAWFAAGKAWDDDSIEVCETEEVFLYLYDDGYLTAGSSISEFEKHINTEIKLIDDLPQYDFASDLPQPTFATQQEILTYLCQNDNKVIHECDMVVGFKNGKLWDFTDNQPFKNESDFINFPNEWKKHTPPRLIRVNGIEVPAPLESLDGLDVVYVANIMEIKKYFKYDVDDGILDYLLSIGLCYATKEDAIKRAEAMRLFEVME